MKHLIILILVAGCAKQANMVAPTAIPVNSVSCSQIADLRLKVASLSARQNTAANNDALGVVLLGLPVASMSGNDVEAELSIAKGQLMAAESKCK